MDKLYFGILKNEVHDSHNVWVTACEKYGFNYKAIDLTKDNWLDLTISQEFECLLLCPSARESNFKKMYDERIFILNKILKRTIYPSYEEVIIHENKNMLSYWLDALDIPHVETHVFYQQNEALNFVKNSAYPIVAKTAIGASGEGVKFIYNHKSAKEYVEKAFTKGIRRKTGPALRQGKLIQRFLRRLFNVKGTIIKLQNYRRVFKDSQTGFVLFQKYIPHQYEWRTVKIGESFFAHKKIKAGKMCSGSKGIEYVNPPFELLDLTREVCRTCNFSCMSIDILEGVDGEYLINELQTIFGHIQDHILEIDGKPGRFIYTNSRWLFEEGDFNTNLSYDLRLLNAVELLKIKKAKIS